MKTIVLNGKRYKLSPYQNNEEGLSEGKEKAIMDDYLPDQKKGEVKKAVPKVSDYRERFKQRKIMRSELIARPSIKKPLKKDRSLDQFQYKGDPLFFGPGVEEEY